MTSAREMQERCAKIARDRSDAEESLAMKNYGDSAEWRHRHASEVLEEVEVAILALPCQAVAPADLGLETTEEQAAEWARWAKIVGSVAYDEKTVDAKWASEIVDVLLRDHDRLSAEIARLSELQSATEKLLTYRSNELWTTAKERDELKAAVAPAPAAAEVEAVLSDLLLVRGRALEAAHITDVERIDPAIDLLRRLLPSPAGEGWRPIDETEEK